MSLTRAKKRRLVEANPTSSAQEPPAKRHKSQPQSQQRFQTEDERRTAFWDGLSKIHLTRRALRELQRRTTQPTRLAQISRVDLSDDELCIHKVKRFARRGGPDLRDLRGYPELTTLSVDGMPFKRSSKSRTHGGSTKLRTHGGSTNPSSQSKPKTGNTSAYDRGFEQNLVDHQVYPDEYEYPDGGETPMPKNWDEINRKLTQSRPSLSPSKFSDGAFGEFRRANAHTFKEDDVTTTMVPIISGRSKTNRSSARNIPFGNLRPLTDGTLCSGQPDLYYGARPEQLDRVVRSELSGFIVPSTQEDLPILPNNFLEVKGPDGSAAVVKRQALLNGGVGARAMNSLQSFGHEPIYDNNAYTITSTYNSGTLQMYTTHPTQPLNPEDQPEYHMNKLRGWDLTDTPETFRQGAGAYRNARDWAKERRDEFIAAANERAQNVITETASFESSGIDLDSVTEEPFQESDTSADELGKDFYKRTEPSLKRPKKGPKQSQARYYRRRSNRRPH